MSTSKVIPLGQPVKEPELFSVNSNPAAPVVELLNAQQREIAKLWGLARANQTIRECLRPTREQVIASLDAVESMALSLLETSDIGDPFEMEDAFQAVRRSLDRVRTPLTYEEQAQEARQAWIRSNEDR